MNMQKLVELVCGESKGLGEAEMSCSDTRIVNHLTLLLC